MDAIRTNNLTKYYGKSRGIRDISLVVEEGDFSDLSARTAPEKAPPSAFCLA